MKALWVPVAGVRDDVGVEPLGDSETEGAELGVNTDAIGLRVEEVRPCVVLLEDGWINSWEPVIQTTQYQGFFRQLAVVFFLSVHFLWKRVQHLLQESC